MSDKKEQPVPARERTFAEKLAAALSDIGMVGKDKTNLHYKYDYTSAAAVQHAVQRALSKHGLYVSSETEIVSTAEYETREKKIGERITMKTTITVSDGVGSASGVGFGCGQDTEDKGPMKAQTASYKYALCALFVIGMGDDPEVHDERTESSGNAATKRELAAAIKEPQVAPAIQEAADLLKLVRTPDELRSWIGIHAGTMAALPSEHKKAVSGGVSAVGKRLGVTKETIVSWLADAHAAAQAPAAEVLS